MTMTVTLQNTARATRKFKATNSPDRVQTRHSELDYRAPYADLLRVASLLYPHASEILQTFHCLRLPPTRQNKRSKSLVTFMSAVSSWARSSGFGYAIICRRRVSPSTWRQGSPTESQTLSSVEKHHVQLIQLLPSLQHEQRWVVLSACMAE